MAEKTTMNVNWTNDADGSHDGGVSYGPGYCISWQRGPISESGRNGAGLIEVLDACLCQLLYFQESKYACPENDTAIARLQGTIEALQSRRDRRAEEGTLGTHQV